MKKDSDLDSKANCVWAITVLEQYKIAQDEYMLYSRAALQSDLILIGATAVLYSWMAATDQTKFPPVTAYIGPLLVITGYVRGFMLGRAVEQIREYMRLLEKDGFNKMGNYAKVGWQQWRSENNDAAGRRISALGMGPQAVAGVFWLALYILSFSASAALYVKFADISSFPLGHFAAGLAIPALVAFIHFFHRKKFVSSASLVFFVMLVFISCLAWD